VRAAACIGLVALTLCIPAGCHRDENDPHQHSAERPDQTTQSADSGTRPRPHHEEPLALKTIHTTDLTEAERQYGRAPVPDPSVVYQPDVLIVAGGAGSVRGVNANGLGCSIDAHVANADRIRPGMIAFVTGRCVGRVLAAQRRGDTLDLILGPVEITDIIREGSFRLEQPLDLDDTIVYEAPDWPGTTTNTDPLNLSGEFAPPRFQRVADEPKTGNVPLVNRKMIGAWAPLSEKGVKFLGYATVNLEAPSLSFVLLIQGGQVTRCELELRGAAGLKMGFDAGTEPTGFTNVGAVRDLPYDVTIPIGGPVPFSVLIRQSYVLQTGFSANSTILKNTGEYAFKGSFRLGYSDKKWKIDAPTGFTVKTSPADAINGASLGFMALVFTHQLKVMVGVGAFGFATGPYTAFRSTIAIARSPDTEGSQFGGPTVRGLARCNQATLTLSMAVGIGYMIPKKITEAINWVLEKLNIEHRIQSSGGLQTDPKDVVGWKGWRPDSPVCRMT
jgi:hypothetical protein